MTLVSIIKYAIIKILKLSNLIFLIYVFFKVSMLQDILLESEKNCIISKKNRRALNAFRSFSRIYDETKLKERHVIARALRDSGLTMKQAREFNFSISQHLWKTCITNIGERPKGGKYNVKFFYYRKLSFRVAATLSKFNYSIFPLHSLNGYKLTIYSCILL